MDNRITVAYGDNPAEMTKALLEAEDLASRIPENALIGPKPNLVVGKPAETGATTHVEIVGGLIAYLREHGRGNLLILEGSWVGDGTKRFRENLSYKNS